MKNPLRLVRSFDKERFSNLLKQAVGSRTQVAFSLQCGISNSYLSKYINKLMETPPIPNTLKKIADNAENNVTIDDLISAARYDSDEYYSYVNNKVLSSPYYVTNQQRKHLGVNRELIVKKLKGLLLSSLTAIDSIHCIPLKPCPPFREGILTCEITDSPSIDLWQFLYVFDYSFDSQLGYIATNNYHEISIMQSYPSSENEMLTESKVLRFNGPKISLVAIEQRTYNYLLSYAVAHSLYMPISVVLVDINEYEVIAENYIKTGYSGNLSQLPRFHPTQHFTETHS